MTDSVPRPDQIPVSTPANRSGNQPLERVTVNLSQRSVQALDSIIASSGGSKTDAVNKALQVWAYLQEVLDNDGTLLTRDKDSDELERLRFI